MKITLLGDSIRIQYENKVRELLGDNFEVFAPGENCRFAKYTLRGLFDWRGGMEGSRIVHWNNGLWDISDLFDEGRLFTSESEYLDNMLRIADILLSKFDKVIFATTTPVTADNVYDKNEDIERYNAILVPKLVKKGVIINDLYSLIGADIDRYVSNDTIHLSEEGIELAAKQVADKIIEVASTIDGDGCSAGAAVSERNGKGAPVIFD